LAACGGGGSALSPKPAAAGAAGHASAKRAVRGAYDAAGGLANGVEWPTGFRPFGASSPWNRPIGTDNPALLDNSDAIVGLAESRNTGTYVHTPEYDAGYDFSHPVVVATSSDPLVTPHCTLYCNPVYLKQPFHIPAQARAASGGDHHLAVVQPDGTEIDLWGVAQPFPGNDWNDGDTIDYGAGNVCGDFYGGSGFVREGATVSGACLSAGLIRASELAAGSIPHALFVTTACLARAYVYPASQPGDNVCTGGGPHVPNGAHVWLDLSDATIDGMPLQPWENTILHALHDYGAFVGDSGGGGRDHTDTLVQVMFEDDAQFEPFGATPPMSLLAQQLGWNPVRIAPSSGQYGGAIRWTASDDWQPVDWSSHLHIVDPCYARGSC
jgi:hypothetical protein